MIPYYTNRSSSVNPNDGRRRCQTICVRAKTHSILFLQLHKQPGVEYRTSTPRTLLLVLIAPVYKYATDFGMFFKNKRFQNGIQANGVMNRSSITKEILVHTIVARFKVLNGFVMKIRRFYDDLTSDWSIHTWLARFENNWIRHIKQCSRIKSDNFSYRCSTILLYTKRMFTSNW